MHAFEISEYQYRLNRVKEVMSERGMDVLLVSDPANMNYLSGYDGWSFYVHQLLIVLLEADQPIWVGRHMDANAAKITTWLDPSHIVPYPDDYVQSLKKHPYDFVADILREEKVENACIAVELDNYYFSAKCFDTLNKQLTKATFLDATSLVNKVRIVKSDTEITYMKRAAAIVENAMKVGIDAIAEGVRECDVVGQVYEAQISGTTEFGGDYPAIVPLIPSGERTSTPHLTWTEQPYKEGDPVIIELAGCYRRYHAPMARTVMIGDPPQNIKDLAEVVIEGLNETLARIGPGMTCEEVEAVWNKSIEKSGFIKESRIGYSVGLSYPPDWGERTASLRKGDKTVLQPNMTFHLIPGIWLDNYGMELSEAFRVTDKGCETLTNFPRQLFVKD
ncbi:M24 family metallopeptidase [Caldalkalibacillus salinus]|uniref:M24 family metallopeptidase n=1 Tax=Caldalkalibacillus salinus TaxID=2803787 RepID=UPI0030173ECF